jgi:hypothetical protein
MTQGRRVCAALATAVVVLVGTAALAQAADIRACGSSRIHHACGSRLSANWGGEVRFRAVAPSLEGRTLHVWMRQKDVPGSLRRIGAARIGPRGVARLTWDAPRRWFHGTFIFRFVHRGATSHRIAVRVPSS